MDILEPIIDSYCSIRNPFCFVITLDMSLPAFFQKFSLQKTLAVLLIFVIFFSQTIRFEVFHTANASPEQYRDIVSIVVDNETYRRLQ